LRSVPAQLAAALVAALSCLASPAAGITVPPDFVAEDAAPGANFFSPTAIAFLPDGRLLVGEKTGFVWVVANGAKLPRPMWDGTADVMDTGDRGLMGIAVDPDFVHNHFVYFAYVADPDSNGIDQTGPSFGRVTRFQIASYDSNLVDYTTKKVLLGRAWADGVPSGQNGHAIDGLRWGEDGSLLVSAGDGAAFDYADAGGHHPDLFLPGRTDPAEDIGAFRAQYIKSLAGKILRINPANGEGYPTNPYFDGDLNSNQSKVWEYGLRNPWRYCVRPGTGLGAPDEGRPGTLYIGDVGWRYWEEFDVAPVGGLNFGWPCYEAHVIDPDYAQVTPAHDGCGSWGTPTNPQYPTEPEIWYQHLFPELGHPPGIAGNCAMGGIFYTGSLYPSDYHNRMFFADFGAGWMRVATFDSLDHLVEQHEFATGADGPVDFAADPRTGDIFFISINVNRVSHLRYTGSVGGNRPPEAHATGTPLVGVVPFTASFSSARTSDPDLDPLSLGWNFGDGQGAGGPTPTHTSTEPGVYDAVLTADDLRGGVGRDTVRIVALETGAFPSAGVLDDFDRANGGIGGQWAGDTTGFAINSGTLELIASYASAVWSDTSFAPEQEAYVSFAGDPDPGTAAGLMLKAQGNRTTDGTVLVLYDATLEQVGFQTYVPGSGWTVWGDPIPVHFGAGDQLGARAFHNGALEVRKNGALVGAGTVKSWPWIEGGGRVGLALVGDTPVRVDDFGGGSVVVNGNHPPQAQIAAPVNGSFFVAGDTIRMVGSATDDRDPPASLHFRWDVSLAHNNHIHPEIFNATGPTAEFVGENHDDGSGVHYIIRLSVTDAGGLSDVRRSEVFPEVDLEAGGFALDPDPWIGTDTPTTVRFSIQNHGRMPAPRTHWALTLDSQTIAEGDTLMGPLASVTIEHVIPPGMQAGDHLLRAAADTLETLRETNETNNAGVRAITVYAGGLAVGPTGFRPPGPARPNPGRGTVSFALGLAHPAAVKFTVCDVAGRRVWSAPHAESAAGAVELRWAGVLSTGGRAPAGLYFARIEIEGRSWVRRFALIR